MGSSFINLTRGNEIGANCYYLEFDGEGILLDAGMHPKLDGYAALPDFSKIRGRSVESAFVSHAHHDHIGALPLLMRHHPEARVFMSAATMELAEPLLCNSVTVMKRQRKESGVEEYPLYAHADVKKSAERWEARPILQPWQAGKKRLFSKKREASFQFHSAGHILGSVAVEIEHEGRRTLYTGDINLADQTIMKAARLPEKGIDTLIMETTRGGQATGHRRDAVVKQFLEAIRDTFQKGGAVLIPVFAMGKTQEALTLLHQARERGELPGGPIYIGGLSRVFTEVYDRMLRGGVRMMEDIRPEMMNGRSLKDWKPKRGHIYLISSGMMTENTLSNVLAQKILPRENDSIFFIGYTDKDSPAGRLRATPRGGRVELHPHTGSQPVHCRVEHFDLTAHVVREDMIAYVERLNPRRCFLVHGDASAMDWFRSELGKRCPNMDVLIPPVGKEIGL